MGFTITFAHSIGRLTHGMPWRKGVDALGALGRARRLAHDVMALVRDPEPRVRAADAVQEAALLEARRLTAAWRTRAEAAEARVGELESRLTDSEMTALELRSRVVCLHGKLATTASTLRYQSMTLALDGGTPARNDGRGS